jgi:hypothetical protein
MDEQEAREATARWQMRMEKLLKRLVMIAETRQPKKRV